MHDVGTIEALGHAALRALGPQLSQHCVFHFHSPLLSTMRPRARTVVCLLTCLAVFL